jgi:hypothetical protein
MPMQVNDPHAQQYWHPNPARQSPLPTCPKLDSQQLYCYQEANQIRHHTCCHLLSNSQESSMVEWRSGHPPHGYSCHHANSATERLDPTTTHAEVADERDRKEMNEDPGSGGRGEMAPPPPSSLPAKHLVAEVRRCKWRRWLGDLGERPESPCSDDAGATSHNTLSSKEVLTLKAKMSRSRPQA